MATFKLVVRLDWRFGRQGVVHYLESMELRQWVQNTQQILETFSITGHRVAEYECCRAAKRNRILLRFHMVAAYVSSRVRLALRPSDTKTVHIIRNSYKLPC